jgi:Tfp pilus assembly protein PilO
VTLPEGKKWKLRHIDAALLAVCALAALPLCLPTVNPLLRPMGYLADQRNQLNVLRDNTASLAQGLANQQRQLKRLHKNLEKHKIQLQSAGNLNRRIAKLTSLAAGSGLEVDEILPGRPSRGGKHETVPVRLLASGSYPTCVAFLSKLKRTFPDTSVGSFELSGTPANPKAPAHFRLHLYWYVQAGSGTTEN